MKQVYIGAIMILNANISHYETMLKAQTESYWLYHYRNLLLRSILRRNKLKKWIIMRK